MIDIKRRIVAARNIKSIELKEKNMLLEEKKIGDVLVVEVLDQRLDAKVAVQFKDQMNKLIDKGNHSIVIALNQVNFIDSSGLGAIVSSLKMLGRKGDMAICGTQDSVKNLFKLTRMDKVFRMFPDMDGAVDALSN